MIVCFLHVFISCNHLYALFLLLKTQILYFLKKIFLKNIKYILRTSEFILPHFLKLIPYASIIIFFYNLY